MLHNQGNIPQKLECVDRVGGIYAIANRPSMDEEEMNMNRNQYGTNQNSVVSQSRPQLGSEAHLGHRN